VAANRFKHIRYSVYLLTYPDMLAIKEIATPSDSPPLVGMARNDSETIKKAPSQGRGLKLRGTTLFFSRNNRENTRQGTIHAFIRITVDVSVRAYSVEFQPAALE
jgi:hypothetical protein